MFTLTKAGCICGLALLLIAVLPAGAFAHPLVDRGIEAYENADFETALSSFARAEYAEDLSREDLVVLLHNRALVYFALGDTDSMERDLRRLARIDAGHEMDEAVPPTVRQAFDRVRQVTEPSPVQSPAADVTTPFGGLPEGDLKLPLEAR